MFAFWVDLCHYVSVSLGLLCFAIFNCGIWLCTTIGILASQS